MVISRDLDQFEPVVLEFRPRGKPDGDIIETILITFHQHSVLTADRDRGSASIELRMVPMSKWHNAARVHKWGASMRALSGKNPGELKLSDFGIFIDIPGMRGLGLGTFLMDQIVQWAMQWPDANVRPISLAAGQATPENKARRNHFYERFGLVFDYRNDGDEGVSRPMKVKALNRVAPPDNVSITPLSVYTRDLIQQSAEQRNEIAKLERSLTALSDARKEAENAPFRWALWTLYMKHQYLLLPLLVALAVVMMVIYR